MNNKKEKIKMQLKSDNSVLENCGIFRHMNTNSQPDRLLSRGER